MDIQAKSFVVGAEVDLDSVKKKVRSRYPDALVQGVRRGVAKNAFFIEMIAAQTMRARATHNLLAQKEEIDFLLRLAGTTQISKAIEVAGAEEGVPFLLVVANASHGLDELPGEVLGGKELRRSRLSRIELAKLETAALLNVLKA